MDTPVAPFLRLTWKDGKRGIVTAAKDDASDALAALIALRGFWCRTCGRGLREADGYACCRTAHCPICGAPCKYHDGCPHVIAQTSGSYTYLMLRHSKLDVKLTPPARRLPGPKGKGYPRWSPAQWQAAYPPDLLAQLDQVFGVHRRDYDGVRLADFLLRHYLCPEFQTAYSDGYFVQQHYFALDPQAAWRRARIWLKRIKVGTDALRAMPPIVPGA